MLHQKEEKQMLNNSICFFVVKSLLIDELRKCENGQENTSLMSYNDTNNYMMEQFLATKTLEGRSQKTIERYKFFIEKTTIYSPDTVHRCS